MLLPYCNSILNIIKIFTMATSEMTPCPVRLSCQFGGPWFIVAKKTLRGFSAEEASSVPQLGSRVCQQREGGAAPPLWP